MRRRGRRGKVHLSRRGLGVASARRGRAARTLAAGARGGGDGAPRRRRAAHRRSRVSVSALKRRLGLPGQLEPQGATPGPRVSRNVFFYQCATLLSLLSHSVSGAELPSSYGKHENISTDTDRHTWQRSDRRRVLPHEKGSQRLSDGKLINVEETHNTASIRVKPNII